MATLPGRIRRISLDAGTPENFTFQATTTYDAFSPAIGASSWGDAAAVSALDQDLSLSAPVEVTGNLGCLITFSRFPEYFTGVFVKVRPTYDSDAGEDPYLEFWTHDSVALTWTRRNSVQLRNGFVGCPTGKAKYFNFIGEVLRPSIDKCWVTLKPGTVGTPTLAFLAVHVFGTCRNVPVTPGDCKNDPNIDCIPDDPCVLEPESCLTPPIDCTDLDPEICTIPPPEWPTLPPPAGGPIPPTLPPDFPLIDLCDAAQVAAYKELLTPEQLEFFTQLLDAAELPCLDDIDGTRQPDPVAPINADPIDGTKVLPKQPIEVYVDPVDLQGKDDPRKQDHPGGGSTVKGLRTKRYILTWSGNDAAAALALVNANVAPLYGLESPSQILQTQWGPAAGVDTLGVDFSPASYGLLLSLSALPVCAQVGIRVQTLRLRGAVDLQDSINDGGVFIGDAAGGCLPQPDWILTPTDSLAPASRRLISNAFYELFHQNLFQLTEGDDIGTTAHIALTIPREDAAQNDALVCSPTFKARSRLGHQRSGCLVGFTAKERQRWLYPWETATYDGIVDPGDYLYHHRPFVIVIDVAVRQVLTGDSVFGISGVGFALNTTILSDTQPEESCV